MTRGPRSLGEALEDAPVLLDDRSHAGTEGLVLALGRDAVGDRLPIDAGGRRPSNASNALPESGCYYEVVVQPAVTSRSPVPTSTAGGSRPRASVAYAGSHEDGESAAASSTAPTATALTQANLIRRLHDRPDDFEATKALQELTARSRAATPNADPAAQDAIVRAGLSGVERMRRWVTRRTR